LTNTYLITSHICASWTWSYSWWVSLVHRIYHWAVFLLTWAPLWWNCCTKCNSPSMHQRLVYKSSYWCVTIHC